MTQSNKRRSPRNKASAPKAAASEVDAGRISPEELTALMHATHGNPFAVLGPHPAGARTVLRALLPGALAVSVLDAAGQPIAELARQDDSALFTGALPAGCTTEVALVWEPPWEQSMMSAAGRKHFGWDDDGDA